jgi:hypothetical protein
MIHGMKSLQDWNNEGRLIIKNQRAKGYVAGVAIFAKSQTREMPVYTKGPKTIKGKPRRPAYNKAARVQSLSIINGAINEFKE